MTASRVQRLALLAAMLVCGAAQAAAPVQSPAEALAQDAREYAVRYGVDPVAAIARLRAQEASVAAIDAIAAEHAGRLAGISLLHSPDFGFEVALTGAEPVADQVLSVAGLAVPVRFTTGAGATRAAIVAAIEAHQAAIRADVPRPPAMGADPRTGELVVMVNGGDVARIDPPALAERWTALTGVPVRVDAIGKRSDDMVAGGERIEGMVGGRRFACTTGFVVTDGARAGIVTAAHCPDEVRVAGSRGERDIVLPFAGQWGWGYQDVQLNLTDGPVAGRFLADTARTTARPVTSWRLRASTRAGDFVCRRGERSGYGCAEVAMTDFAPAGDLCGGACLPTWVAVTAPTCRGGDSGAPVFVGTTALGIVKGGTTMADGSCAFYFYMSTDYLPSGWRLMTDPPALVPLPSAG